MPSNPSPAKTVRRTAATRPVEAKPNAKVEKAVPLNATAAKLLDAAGELMTERNTTDISLSDIAQRSGINAALVKYHFGNKDGLLLALLARSSTAEIATLEHVLDQPMSATEKMRRHIAGIINAYYRFPYLNRLIHLLLHDGSEETATEVRRFFTGPLFALVKRMLEEGVASGEFRRVDPVLFYISLNGACDHLFHSRQSGPLARMEGVTDDMRRRYIDHMTTLILGGLVTDKANMPTERKGKSSART